MRIVLNRTGFIVGFSEYFDRGDIAPTMTDDLALITEVLNGFDGSIHQFKLAIPQ